MKAIRAAPTSPISAWVCGMRLRNSLFLLVALLLAPFCAGGTFAVLGPQAGSWPAVLSSVGHISGPAASADIFVVPPNTPASADWENKIQKGAALILAGPSPLAASFGFRPRDEIISVVHVIDIYNASLPIIWSKAVDLPRYDIPAGARVFAKDRW